MYNPFVRTHGSLLIDLSVRQLRAFVTVADSNSYAEAAERLHYTEPTVHAQIKRLEAMFGRHLFERSGRRVHLTVENRALPRRATILERRAGLLREVEGFAGAITGHVWISESGAGEPRPERQRFVRFLHDAVDGLSTSLSGAAADEPIAAGTSPSDPRRAMLKA